MEDVQRRRKPRIPFGVRVLAHAIGLTLMAVGTVLLGAGWEVVVAQGAGAKPEVETNAWSLVAAAYITAAVTMLMFVLIGLALLVVSRTLREARPMLVGVVRIGVVAVGVPAGYGASTALLVIAGAWPAWLLVTGGLMVLGIGIILSTGFWTAALKGVLEYWRHAKDVSRTGNAERTET